jgi:cytochrome c
MVRLLGRSALGAFAAAGLLAFAGSASADANSGKTIFTAQCGVCHSATKGAGPKVGPNLFGVYGRVAGTGAGFSYSPAMKTAGLTWDSDALTAYLRSPSAKIRGNRMPFAGLSKPGQAEDVAAYLKTLK